MNVAVNTTRVFSETKNAKTNIVLNRGGTRSSKSYSILQILLFLKFLSEENKRILILRKTGPSLNLTTLDAFRRMINEYNLNGRIKEEKVFKNFHYKNNFLHFDSLDDPYKKKSSEWNYIFFEELNEFSFDDFMTMKLYLSARNTDPKNPNQIYAALNPVDEYCWVKEKLLDSNNFDVTEIVSTYKDNLQNLNLQTIKDIESLAKQNKNFHRVYCCGEWGHLDNLIYLDSEWDIIEKYPNDEFFDAIFYGLDFGYNHPTALIQIGVKDNEFYEKELLYQTELTNKMLIKRLEKLIPFKVRGSREIYADSEDSNRIQEIYNAGFFVTGVEKKKGSVKAGIDVVKSYKIHVEKNSYNLIKERRGYTWQMDRNGHPLEVEKPVKFNDHACDAERYGIYSFWKAGNLGSPRVRWL